MYKYNMMSWLRGDIKGSELLELEKRGEIDPEVSSIIREHQRIYFLYFLNTLFESRIFACLARYRVSLIDQELLIDADIELVKREIEEFKLKHRAIYVSALSGLDDRHSLTMQDCYKLLTDPTEVDIQGTYFDILVKIKFLKWLNWLKVDGKNPETEPSYKDNFWSLKGLKERIAKYWPEYSSFDHKSEEVSKDYNDIIEKADKEQTKLAMAQAISQIQSLLKSTKYSVDEETPTDKAPQKNVSYKWLNNPDEELPKLCQLLKEKLLIHSDTTVEQFKTVFTAKPLEKIEPIKWDSGNGAKGLLAYFIDSIYPNRIHFNIDQWSVAEKCFTNAKKLAQSKQRYLGNNSKKHPGKPKNYQIVDEVLKGL